MGQGADAYLIWGLPVVAYTDEWDDARDGPVVTPFWDEEAEWWREFPNSELKIMDYGHYDDPDNERGILTSTHIKRYRADAWDPTRIPTRLEVPPEALEDFVRAGFNIERLDLAWWLVASYG